MNGDRELEESFQALAEESRRQLGEPPSSQQLLAYHRGELPAVEAERVREHLARDPATLDRFLDLVAHVPDPDRPDHLPEEVLAEDWEVIRRRLRLGTPDAEAESKPRAAVMVFPAKRRQQVERFVAVAAVLAVVFLGFRLGIVGQRADELSEKLTAPRLDEGSFRLLPDGTRGDSTAGEPPIRIHLGEVGAHLTLTLFDPPDFGSYRLAVHVAGEPEGAAPRWTNVIARQPGDAFEIGLPPGFLPHGEYVFRLYGVSKEVSEPLATYSVRFGG